MIIAFIYRIADKIYHGKYIGYVSDDYDEGLDIELRKELYPVWKNTYPISKEEDVSIGIISYCRSGYEFFSENEKNVFDTLYCNWTNEPKELFIHGNRIKVEI
jgi:hypothetical protein